MILNRPAEITVLNPRYETFCLEYVRTNNQTKAYEAAGFKSKGAVACAAASRLLKMPKIQQRLREIEDEIMKKAIEEMRTEWHKLRKTRRSVAYHDPAALFDKDGKPLNIHDIPKAARRAIAGYKITKDGDVEIKLRDPHPHLSAMEDKYAIMPDNQKPSQKVEVTGQINGQVQIQGKLPTVDDCEVALKALLDKLLARATPEELRLIKAPPKPGEFHEANDYPERQLGGSEHEHPQPQRPALG